MPQLRVSQQVQRFIIGRRYCRSSMFGRARLTCRVLILYLRRLFLSFTKMSARMSLCKQLILTPIPSHISQSSSSDVGKNDGLG